jgi:hypothetical protein
MSRWFRFYDSALDDPKVQSLPADLFKTWVNLLCIASKNEGDLSHSDLPFLLRMDTGKTDKQVRALADRGLLDPTEGGYEPHNWNDRQYKSDVSTDRVKQFRKRKRNVSSDVSATPPDTEQNTEQKKSSEANASGATAPIDFEKLAFERGKEVLGKSAGGVVARLKREKCKTWPATLAVIEEAATKASPMEWVQGVLRQADPDEAIYRNVI